MTKPQCRLINPTRSEIGRISRQYLQNINSEIRSANSLTQWRNTKEVICWFKEIQSKSDTLFLQYDIVNFYPSITQVLFTKAIQYARRHTTISDSTYRTILHARQSLLFTPDSAWSKKNGLFDVTMGAYDGAEVCELVGLYLLNKIKESIPSLNSGLYRDDGLGIYKKKTAAAPPTKYGNASQRCSSLKNSTSLSRQTSTRSTSSTQHSTSAKTPTPHTASPTTPPST